MRIHIEQPYDPGSSLSELSDLHPFPWREQRAMSGAVRMLDANHVEVNLFAITRLAEIVTGRYAQEKNAEAKQEGQPI